MIRIRQDFLMLNHFDKCGLKRKQYLMRIATKIVRMKWDKCQLLMQARSLLNLIQIMMANWINKISKLCSAPTQSYSDNCSLLCHPWGAGGGEVVVVCTHAWGRGFFLMKSSRVAYWHTMTRRQALLCLARRFRVMRPWETLWFLWWNPITSGMRLYLLYHIMSCHSSLCLWSWVITVLFCVLFFIFIFL